MNIKTKQQKKLDAYIRYTNRAQALYTKYMQDRQNLERALEQELERIEHEAG